jgi:hypothetical protein
MSKSNAIKMATDSFFDFILIESSLISYFKVPIPCDDVINLCGRYWKDL